MIISFAVSNYRSFAKEETLSLIASKRLSGAHEDHTVPIPNSNERVLTSAVIYGANGAGKSNLFKALQFLKQVALRPRGKGKPIGRTPFLLDPKLAGPTVLDIQFMSGDQVYRFGVELDEQRIIEEWLARVIGNKEQTLYERKTSSDGEVTATIHRGFSIGKKLRALFSVGGPANQTLLATIRANLNKEDIGDELNAVLNWFQRGLTLISPDQPFAPVGHMLNEDPTFLNFAGEFLKAASTGVDHLVVKKKEISRDELKKILPNEILEEVLGSSSDMRGLPTLVGNPDGAEYLIESGADGHVYKIAVESAHIGESGSTNLSIQEESDGTRRLLELIPTLHRMKNTRSVYFIDEIDRSLHPSLVHKFLDFFLRSCAEGQHQIILTTHESTLLDLGLLRRDEIWFAEKDTNNATHLYSLSDFKVRKDSEVRKHYLQGRFGAIPFLGSIDQLMCKEDE